MTVFVTGATGVFGRRIVDELTDRNRTVVGLSRDADGDAAVRDSGGVPVRGDVLDQDGLRSAADAAGDRSGEAVDAVIHAATRLPPAERTTAEYWERNDEVRREGARNLVAALGDDVDRFVFPSVVWVARQPDGSCFDETAERYPDRATRSAAEVEDFLADAAADHGFDPLILRTGFFYGPDDHTTRSFAENLRSGDLPIVGGGILGRKDAELSMLHVDDAGCAVAAAVDAGVTGLYHVVDDEPVTVADYLRTFAYLLDAPEPSRVPWWLARPFAGKDAVRFMTSPMPTSSEKFRADVGWEPDYPTYREGLEQVVEAWRADGTLAELRGDEDADTGTRTNAVENTV
ncbi:NAD-dependent epimerase/dehydratase family protein [Halomicrobium salinisoli]|uniref:NAD-dependent epimerase/dehydratase family protein n=1 Tax=Halomicrobium salinisoli TaxID=2878391 RepID=UPI001CF07635|nr:NAD(P)-dependent oxidoreductase [Halomicrobium salinisoli]